MKTPARVKTIAGKSRRSAVRLCLVLLASCVCVQAARPPARPTITNPVAPRGQDPWVTQSSGLYYYCYSHRDVIWVNADARLERAVQYAGKRVWRPQRDKPWSRELWAPELHYLAGCWYIYVAADDGRNENHRMYVLQAQTSDPTGPYALAGKIGDSSDKWAIDGTVMRHRNGLYFIWSGWEGDVNVRQNLYIAPMSDPTTISGDRVMISTPQYRWEKIGHPLVNEGPQVLTRRDRLFVIYSASGSWTDHYCLGRLELVGVDPLNPDSWRKKPEPVFQGTDTIFSPGHASFTKSPDCTQDWIVYHTAKHRGAGWNRCIRMQPFTWNEQGAPVFGRPVPDNVEIPAPSQRPPDRQKACVDSARPYSGSLQAKTPGQGNTQCFDIQ